MFQELYKMKVEPGLLDILKMLFSCRKIVKNASKTFKEYFDQFGITDPEVQEIFNIFSAFSALPEDKVAALVPVSAMNSLLAGAYRPKSGFIEFPRAFEKRVVELGGQIKTRAQVERILVESGVVKGVEIKGGEIIPADYVITTVDPKLAMNNLVGSDIIRSLDQEYAAKVDKVRMSTSSMNISLGLDKELDLAGLGMDSGYNVITTGGDTFSALWDSFEDGSIGFNENRFHLGIICPSLTTGGKPNLTIRVVPMALGDWAEWRKNDREFYNQQKETWADFFIDLVERYLIPDLKKHILVKDIATPATYARYSGSPTGSIYDMAPYIDNFGRTRLKMRTPVKGLFQPRFIHGVIGALFGGMQAVDMILEGRVMNGYARL
jgi:phytoene dehydrogenase-like protein